MFLLLFIPMLILSFVLITIWISNVYNWFYYENINYLIKEKNVINTTCMYFDAASLLLFVRKIDENAFFTITDIKRADGYIYVSQKMEENDINKKAN